MAISPFRIDVSEAVLDDLRSRLERTRWPDAVEDGGSGYGVDPAYVRSIVEEWRTSFDWRAAERRLNAIRSSP